MKNSCYQNHVVDVVGSIIKIKQNEKKKNDNRKEKGNEKKKHYQTQ